MWFGRNQTNIKLSKRLRWSVGKGRYGNNKFWFIGAFCLILAGGLFFHTNQLLKTPNTNPKPTVLGATTTQTNNPGLQFMDYQVTRGDTLFTISKQFGVPTETLAQLNDLNTPFTLKAGQIIKVPLH